MYWFIFPVHNYKNRSSDTNEGKYVFEEGPPKAAKDKGAAIIAKGTSTAKADKYKGGKKHYFNDLAQLFAEKSGRLKSPHNTARAYFRDIIL